MGMMESMMSYHILPEVISSEPYLSMRAVWFYGQFESFSYTDQNHIEHLMDGVFKCLNDRNLPVRFYAATTIYKLLKNNEYAQRFLKPALKEVLDIYLNLMTEIESEELVTALERIVAFYKEDMKPFAIKLSEQLVDSYQKLILVDVKEDGGESAVAAVGCFTALTRIIRSCRSDAELLGRLERIIYPILEHTLSG
jgi:hypothetical protein